MFVIFRWVADQDPPAESVQLGLISVLGSLSYLLACRLVSRLGPRLAGRRMPVCGLLIGIVCLVLLTANQKLWAMYVLCPVLGVSGALLFPSLTGSIRYGRSGQNLRSVLFLFCLAGMSGITFGAYFGSKLYGMSAVRVGGSYVYLVNIGIQLICLLLYLRGQRQKSLQVAPGPEETEQVETGLARVFMGIGWLGNILVMVCTAVLLNLFNKVATDLGFKPEVHGWLVVAIRGASLATAALMFYSIYWHHRWWSFLLAEGLAVAGLCLVGLTGDYWLFMLGLLFVGVALILGIGVKLAGYTGAFMMFLMWLAVLPLENNPIIDDHFIYIIIMLGFTITNPGDWLGFGKKWASTNLVKKYKFLR